MLKVHFHVDLGEGAIVKDEEGENRPSLAEAIVEARAIASELMAERLKRNRNPFQGSPRILVHDSDGAELATVCFRDAFAGCSN